MKTIILSLLGLSVAIIAGCSTTPTAFDRAVSNVETNYVPKLVLQTNVVTVVNTITKTNEVGVPVPVYVTNVSSVITYQTNMVPQYVLTGPTTTATGVARVAGTVANLGAPGTGTLVTGGVLGLLSIFLGFRNRQMSGQNDALSQAAGVLAQTIETGREIMSKTPQGQQAADAFTAWMIKNQAATGVISQVSQIVKDSTDNVQAQAAANQILALIGQPTTPVKPAA